LAIYGNARQKLQLLSIALTPPAEPVVERTSAPDFGQMMGTHELEIGSQIPKNTPQPQHGCPHRALFSREIRNATVAKCSDYWIKESTCAPKTIDRKSSCRQTTASTILRPMPKQQPATATENQPAEPPRDSPLSLNRLREAFAAMLGGQPAGSEGRGARSEKPNEIPTPHSPLPAPCSVTPSSVIEAVLFLGRPDNGPTSARELAAAMRGVSPKEVEAAVNDLNAVYDGDQSPYRIEQTAGGYRLVLRPEFERMRDKFYGRVKEARLSPAVVEVLSVLAYNQPATIEQLNELRGSPCGAALSTLVRRKLVRLDRVGDSPQYATTERFLKLFGLDNLESLPRSEEL
jgi:segregation and condensation protein B